MGARELQALSTIVVGMALVGCGAKPVPDQEAPYECEAES
jgi:hypothetical protein